MYFYVYKILGFGFLIIIDTMIDTSCFWHTETHSVRSKTVTPHAETVIQLKILAHFYVSFNDFKFGFQ